jgi:hypothetical protein
MRPVPWDRVVVMILSPVVEKTLVNRYGEIHILVLVAHSKACNVTDACRDRE